MYETIDVLVEQNFRLECGPISSMEEFMESYQLDEIMKEIDRINALVDRVGAIYWNLSKVRIRASIFHPFAQPYSIRLAQMLKIDVGFHHLNRSFSCGKIIV